MPRPLRRAGAVLLGAAVLMVFAGAGAERARGQPQPGIRCGPGATSPNPLAAMTRITSPTPMERVSGALTVRGAIRTTGPQVPLYIAVKDPTGGTMAEQFLGAQAGDGGDFIFSQTFSLPVIQETAACIWVILSGPDIEGVQGQFLAFVPVTLLPTPGPPATQFRASPFFANNTGPDLIAATKAYVEGSGRAAVPIVAARITRVVKNWAAVRIFPPPGTTDPATVIMTRPDAVSAIGDQGDTGWRGVTFGTGALCLDRDEPVPPILCNYPLHYVGEDARLAVASIDARQGRRTFSGRGFVFDYPADGRVVQPAIDPFLVRVLRSLSGPESLAFPAFFYNITIQPTLAGPGTVDSWGYSRMIAETTDLTLCPVTGTYFETGGIAVFQVDCVDGAAILRRFYVTPKGQEGSVALLVSVTVPLEGLNPWQPDADAAVTLLLQTLRLATGE